MKNIKFGVMSLILFAACSPVACAPVSDGIRVGSYVEIEYSLEADGAAIVQEASPEYMKLVVGSGSYPEALEQALVGLKVGDEKVITLTPGDAYGTRRTELVSRVSKDQLPPRVVNASPGEIISATGDGGQPVVMRVIQVLEDSVVLDRNHPLAGKTLVYRVRVKAAR